MLPKYIDSRNGWVFLGLVFFIIFSSIVWTFIGTIIASLFFYYGTRPLSNWLNKFLPTESLAPLISLLSIITPVLILLGASSLIISEKIVELTNLPNMSELITKISPSVLEIQENIVPNNVYTNPSEFISTIAPGTVDALSTILVQYAGGLTQLILKIFALFVIAFYLLREGHKFRKTAHCVISNKTTLKYLEKVDRELQSIFFGNIVNALATSILAIALYSVLRISTPIGFENPFLLGALTGLASLIPVIGVKLVYIPYSAYISYLIYLQGGGATEYMFVGWFLFLAVFIVDILPDIFLRPYVSADDTHLGWLIVAYTFGPLIFGWYGLFLGPIILVAMYQFIIVILPEITNAKQSKLKDFI